MFDIMFRSLLSDSWLSCRGNASQRGGLNVLSLGLYLGLLVWELDLYKFYSKPDRPDMLSVGGLNPANTKHLHNICTMLDQRLRRWADVVQMLHKFVVLADLAGKTHAQVLSQHICNGGRKTLESCWFPPPGFHPAYIRYSRLQYDVLLCTGTKCASRL